MALDTLLVYKDQIWGTVKSVIKKANALLTPHLPENRQIVPKPSQPTASEKICRMF